MQTIKYKWLNQDKKFEPFIFTKHDNEMSKMKLIDERISLSVGKKRCIGFFKNSRHVNCPHNRVIETGWNCNECRLRDDFFQCMRCTGESCINEKQRPSCKETQYFMYLAAFDSVLKVGISYEFRILERLIEQGADFGAKIALIKDGMEVRKVEQKVKTYLNIVDFVTGDQKQGMIFGDPNKSIPNILGAISKLQKNGVSKYMIHPEIYDLRSYYKLENVAYNPAKIKITENAKIDGTIIAAKGSIVILKNDQGLFSFNSHDLIGRDLIPN